MNKIMLKGRLTADPKMNTTANNISVVTFTVAVNRRFDREKTDFITCEAWRQTAEFINKYFSKGKEIALCGELHIDESKKDGETRYFTKVTVDEVEFCGSKTDNDSAQSVDVSVEDDDGDLPF